MSQGLCMVLKYISNCMLIFCNVIIITFELLYSVHKWINIYDEPQPHSQRLCLLTYTMHPGAGSEQPQTQYALRSPGSFHLMERQNVVPCNLVLCDDRMLSNTRAHYYDKLSNFSCYKCTMSNSGRLRT